MQIRLYSTLTRRVEEFKPLKKQAVGLYTCGPTVYNYAHIGNLRTYIFEDILKRVLLYNSYKVTHVMNITDVGHLTSDADTGEDKLEKGARREGKSAWEIAEQYTQAFVNDMRELNILPPDTMPRATDHIKEQIALIKTLEQKGFTYRTSDGIYFDTAKLNDYGKLVRLGKQRLKVGARVAVGEKKHPTDFALWKFSPADQKRQMEWKSPWGAGFPGWHIECSAMSVKYLGQPFDIHCGGIDHMPVHHINEIAQSEAAAGKPLANYWLHGEFLVIEGEKMAKSGQSFITLQILREKGFNSIAYRYLLLQTHYRKQLTFSWKALEAAQNGLEHLYNVVRTWKGAKIGCAEYEQRFLEAVNNDLDMPAALALAWDLVKDAQYPNSAKKRTLLKFDRVFGLGLDTIQEEPIPAEIMALVKQRDEARKQKDWASSDELRRLIENKGYKVKDTKEGSMVSKT